MATTQRRNAWSGHFTKSEETHFGWKSFSVRLRRWIFGFACPDSCPHESFGFHSEVYVYASAKHHGDIKSFDFVHDGRGHFLLILSMLIPYKNLTILYHEHFLKTTLLKHCPPTYTNLNKTTQSFKESAKNSRLSDGLYRHSEVRLHDSHLSS